MREIRPYGSVRGVRRKPYPYRDTLLPMRSSVLLRTLAETEISGLPPSRSCAADPATDEVRPPPKERPGIRH
jgi:hypothetical protein